MGGYELYGDSGARGLIEESKAKRLFPPVQKSSFEKSLASAKATSEFIRNADGDAVLWSFIFESEFGVVLTPPQSNGLKRRLAHEKKAPSKSRSVYALLVSSYPGAGIRLNDMTPLACEALLSEGVNPNNIYLLSNAVLTRMKCHVDGYATVDALEMVLQHLSKKVSDKDTFFFYSSSHGGQRKTTDCHGIERNCASLGFWNDYILDSELAKMLGDIQPGIGIGIFDQCFGGDFAYEVGKGNYIGISAAARNNYAHVGDEGNTFASPFFQAFLGKKGDLDGDGRVSIGDAFMYAVTNDPCSQNNSQTPQIYSGEINPYTVYLDI